MDDFASRHERLRAAVRDLEAWGHARDWLGSDPYEGLNAVRPRAVRRRPLGRRLLIQAVKRSPVDLRPALGITARHNAAAVAQIAMGYANATFLDEEVRRARLAATVERLYELRRPEYREACWSYHFDMESRAFFYPATMPNTIATAWAGHALLDAYEVTRDERALEHAVLAGQFFLRHVPRTASPDGSYFGYYVGDRTPIHNANMLACGLLARIHQVAGLPGAGDAVEDGVRHTIAHQRRDGSWVYGEAPNMRWVDGFHTGYVIDSLWHCTRAFDRPAWDAALERGLAFYRDRLFLPDGTAKYYANKVHPIDAQSIAQGIRTMALTGPPGRPDRIELGYRVLERALATMRRRDGAFRFQRRRHWRNSAPHIRWVQAPMFDAMARLLAVDQLSP